MKKFLRSNVNCLFNGQTLSIYIKCNLYSYISEKKTAYMYMKMTAEDYVGFGIDIFIQS